MTRCLKCHRIIQTAGRASYCVACVPASNGMAQGWKRTRAAVLERDGHRCVLCGATTKLDVDHVIPRSQGGTDALSNLRTLCRSYNVGGARCG